MPKLDRCAQLKKESAKVKKKVAADNHQQGRSQEEEDDAPVATKAAEAAAKLPRASARGAADKASQGKSAFAKATAFGGDGASDGDEEPVQHYVAHEAVEATQGKGKKAKKQQANRHMDDMQMLAEEQRAALRQRIIDRLLRILMVGLVLDSMRGRAAAAAKEATRPKKQKGSNSGGRSSADADRGFSFRVLFEKVDLFGGPFLMLVLIAAVFAVRICEEGYRPPHARWDQEETNFYEVLGVPSNADHMDIRKTYKALALSWHPDKNPGCETCPERFAKISKAYETLSSPEQRKAYDQRRSPEGSLSSVTSVDLTAEDFEARVSRSNEVWIVQVFDPNEGPSQGFHPVWEEVALQYQHIVRFGRIDASKHRRALDFLPQRVVVMPIVFRFARGHSIETSLWDGDQERGTGTLARFVEDNYPAVRRIADGKELRRWWAAAGQEEQRPRLLVTGPVSAPRRRASGMLQVQRVAHMWAEFLDFALAEGNLVGGALGREFAPGQGASVWSITLRVASQTETRAVRDLKDVAEALQELIATTITGVAPFLTVRNHQQLCSASGLGHVTRTFCLMLVDSADDGGTAKTLRELNASRSAYAQEVLELTSSGEEGGEELFHIQPVRVMRSTSRLPWRPAGAGSAFNAVWSEAGRAAAFVLELETQRIAPVRSSSMSEIFQQIAYEDLKFHELPEGLSLVRGLPDPEVPLQRELMRLLSTPLGAFAAFILLAVAGAVLPELSFLTTCISVASSVMLLMLCWPVACRRCIAVLWCLTSPSRYECQANA